MAQARQQLPALLTAAEQGQPVVIERRGVRFTLRATPFKRASRRPARVIEVIDPAVAQGRWTWTWSARGLGFSRRRQRR